MFRMLKKSTPESRKVAPVNNPAPAPVIPIAAHQPAPVIKVYNLSQSNPETKPKKVIEKPKTQQDEELEPLITPGNPALDEPVAGASEISIPVNASNQETLKDKQTLVWAMQLISHKELTSADKIGLPKFFKTKEDLRNLEDKIFEYAVGVDDVSYVTIASDLVGQIEDLFNGITLM